jgi:glyoxylase I family protein
MPIEVRGLTPLLEVYDLPASLRFYRDVLGFELIAGDDTWWCMLRLGETSVMLNTAYEHDERPAVPEGQRVRGHGDTSLYFTTDPDAAYAHLRERGWPAREPSVTSYGMRQTSTRDPDGFQLFFVRPPGSDEPDGS